MTAYWYVPFKDNKSFRSSGQSLADRKLSEGGKTYQVAYYKELPKKLTQVQPGEKVYVDAHGQYNPKRGKRFIGASAAEKLSAKELAARLKTEGLPDTHEDLRVFACYSGTTGQTKGFFGGTKDVEPFAAQLARELKKLGYESIRVTGYDGEVTYIGVPDGQLGNQSGHTQKGVYQGTPQVDTYVESSVVTRAKDVRVVYSADPDYVSSTPTDVVTYV